MNLKAQFWSFDVIFAVVIFSVAITILAFTWFNVNNQLSLSYGSGTTLMQLQAQALSQTIFSTGSPSNWQTRINTTNTLTWSAVSVGLMSTSGTANLSTNKVYTLLSMSNYNYQATKQSLGVAYDYFITIRNNPLYGAGLNITIGKNPTKNRALTVFVEKRSAFINGIPVALNITLWTNTTLATG